MYPRCMPRELGGVAECVVCKRGCISHGCRLLRDLFGCSSSKFRPGLSLASLRWPVKTSCLGLACMPMSPELAPSHSNMPRIQTCVNVYLLEVEQPWTSRSELMTDQLTIRSMRVFTLQ